MGRQAERLRGRLAVLAHVVAMLESAETRKTKNFAEYFNPNSHALESRINYFVQKEKDISILADLVEQFGHKLEPQHAAFILHRARVQLTESSVDKKELQRLRHYLCKVILHNFQDYDLQTLSDILAKFARLKLQPERLLLDRIQQETALLAAEMTPYQLSTIAHFYATFGIRDRAQLGVLAYQTQRTFAEFKRQDIVMVLWSLAKLRYYDKGLFTDGVARVVKHIENCTVADITQLAWALAKVQHHDKAALDAIGSQCYAVVHDMEPRSVAGLAWSFAVLKHRDLAVMMLLAKRAVREIEQFRPQEVANLLWAYATLGVPEQEVFEVGKRQVMYTNKEFGGQDLSDIAWAFVTAKLYDAHFFNVMAVSAAKVADTCGPARLPYLIWAYAVADHYHEILFRQLAPQAVQLAPQMTAQGLANTAWGCAKLRYFDATVFRAVAPPALEQLNQFTRLQRKMMRAAVIDFVNANPAGVDNAVIKLHGALESDPVDVM